MPAAHSKTFATCHCVTSALFLITHFNHLESENVYCSPEQSAFILAENKISAGQQSMVLVLMMLHTFLLDTYLDCRQASQAHTHTHTLSDCKAMLVL